MKTYQMVCMVVLGLLLSLVGIEAVAEGGAALEIMEKAHQAYYYAGDGGHARVAMAITDKKGRTREREFWMLRRDIAEMGDQRYYTYFLKPADVSGTTFLVHKKAEGNDDRWLYIPALDLVKRIAANDGGSSFMGSDFSYEDVSGRLPNLDTHEIVGQDTMLDRPATKIKSVPKESKTADFSYKLTWIDDESSLPLREEYYDKKDRQTRVFEVLTIEEVEGFPTATLRRMSNVKKGSKTELSFSELTYEPQLEANDFNERLLRNPPRNYTR
ncbi:outer membrane lipoprotein-sorting protein [Candidatus Eisenbacteria bacterium]|uniref:Outer membrane lipoprotein-sorting protein n=1 Tax=Eiseniibacteriota bacterium TaxID=2212470 RepID=A0ABV6YIW5_UNCEI